MAKPDWWDGWGPASEAPANTELFMFTPTINPLSKTSVQITSVLADFSIIPTGYVLTVTKKIKSGISMINDPDYPPQTINSSSSPITVNNLIEGGIYVFSLYGTYASAQSNTVSTDQFQMPTDNFSIQTFSSARRDFKPSKSYLAMTVTEEEYKAKKYGIAYRIFPSIAIPATKSTSATDGDAYEDGYFSYGCSLLMDNLIDNPQQMGGVGFFVDGLGQNGYYVIIESTSSAAELNKKSVRIVKFANGKAISLKEIGARTESTIEGIYGGRTYNIDIKVKLSNKKVTIDAYVNGYHISYVDQTYKDSKKILYPILAPTTRVAVLCGRGTVAFDYAYGTKLEDYQYNDSSYNLNLYQGQFSNDLVNTSYGDLIYNGNYTEDELNNGAKKETAVDEFGTVVREIAQVGIKYDTRPAYPIKWSTGINSNANIIGQKISNFGAQAYVLNNTSSTIPLSNGIDANLYIYGNTLGSSGQLEYVADSTNPYANKEPVIFQSTWLQNVSDVKELAEWIKNKVINKGKIVTMSIFGNPLLSVGDIVSIKYSYQGYAGTENFIITNVQHSFAGGLDTTITCRSL